MTSSMDRVTATSVARELTETDLDHVVGGDAALSHEVPHASNIPKKPLIAIIAILIG